MKTRSACLPALLFALVIPAAGAQATTVTTTNNAGELARILIGGTPGNLSPEGHLLGNGVEVVSASMTLSNGSGTPAADSFGLFTGAPAGLGFTDGVALTTGNVNSVLTAGDAGSQSAQWSDTDNPDSLPPADWYAANGNNFPNAPGAAAPTSGNAFDPAMLTLQVIPHGAFLDVGWLFASEEFETPSEPYNDLALILVTSAAQGNPPDKNCAILPGNRPATVNLTDTSASYFRSDPTRALTSIWGSTTPQICRVNVVPGETLTLRLLVFDVSDGGTDSALLLGAGSIRADTPPSAAIAASPRSAVVPATFSFSTAGTADDRSIATWQLQFGDGTSTSGNGTPPAQVAHEYTTTGSYTATLTVTDGSGQQSSATDSVTVDPQPAPGTATEPTSPAASTPPGSSPPASTPSAPAPASAAGAPRLTVPASITVKKALAGVPVTLACSAACSHKALLTVDRATAKRLGVRGTAIGKRVVVGSAQMTLTEAGTKALKVKFSNAAARRLRALRRGIGMTVLLKELPAVSRKLTLKPR